VQFSPNRRSCDDGLTEEVTQNRCVTPDGALLEATCRAVVESLRLGRLPEPFQPFVAESRKRAACVKEK